MRQKLTESSRPPKKKKKGRRKKENEMGFFFHSSYDLLSTCCKLVQHGMSQMSAAGTTGNVLQSNGMNTATSVEMIYFLQCNCDDPELIKWK